MITIADLKRIVMLTYLTDPMLEELIRIVDVLKFDRDEMIFREQEAADRFYMLRSGHVLLEQQISEQVTACVAAIKPGYAFGWSAMMAEEVYTMSAVCQEPSEVFSFTSQKAQRLFQSNPELGLTIHRRLLVIIKKRLDIRTEQFRLALKNHPDMQALFT